MKRNNQDELLQAEIKRLAEATKLDSWSSFVEQLEIPVDMLPALMTGRHELMKLVQPRAIDASECAKLLQLIGALFETNSALREHAEQVARLVNNWGEAFVQLRSLGNRIQQFAMFALSDAVADLDDTEG